LIKIESIIVKIRRRGKVTFMVSLYIALLVSKKKFKNFQKLLRIM